MFSVFYWHQNDTPLYTESAEIGKRILLLFESGFMGLDTLFWVLMLCEVIIPAIA